MLGAYKHMLSSTLFVVSTACAFAEPSFDCRKAESSLEKLVCSDPDLSTQDRTLADQVRKATLFYGNRGSNSFLVGQRKWLKLRDEACLLSSYKDTRAAQKSCVLSVYRWRIKEIASQLAIQGVFDIDLGLYPIVDFDKALDEPDNFVTYSDDMSAMYYKTDFDNPIRKLPHSCRELYTLTSGDWRYSMDTIGQNSELSALDACNFKLLSLENMRQSARKEENPFRIEDFSSEFACMFQCTAEEQAHPQSFEERARSKSIVIEHAVADDDLVKYDEPEHASILRIFQNHYSLDGQIVHIRGKRAGCFYRCDRPEVLLNIFSYGVRGTMRENELVVAYWDESKKLVRPYLIKISSYLAFRENYSLR